jgi:Zn-dependent protease
MDAEDAADRTTVMGWQDRDYSAGREEMRAYFANPMGLLQYALPIWRSSGLQIRLSFWFLLAALFLAIDHLRAGTLVYIPIDIALLLGVCLLHEWGHRIFARRVGGNHWEWVLWPLGGMVAPSTPRTAKAVFVANIGGIAFNVLLLGVIAGVALAFRAAFNSGNGSYLPVGLGISIAGWQPAILHAMSFVAVQCVFMIVLNLFPCFWFDGGHIWQAVLWPFLGQWKAGTVTCMAGMILAVPLFLLSLKATSIFGMFMWALVFVDCFKRRQMLKAAGAMGVEDEETTYNYMDTPEPKTHRKPKKRWLNAARRRALADQAEQAKIDAILAKVKERGLHSLTWWEKRTLKKATARQREQDLAGRL